MKTGVLACSKGKASAACAAVNLYQGRTFRAALGVLRARGCERVVVLSARYGAVEGSRVIAPYDETLVGAPVAMRRAWAERARVELAALVGDDPVVAIVPADYARALEGLRQVERLHAGLSQGRLYAALAAELRSGRAVA
jgi:hypothetical protein